MIDAKMHEVYAALVVFATAVLTVLLDITIHPSSVS